MIVGGLIAAAAGLLLIGMSVAMQRERLPRNSIAGVRTPATMRSDAAFRTANKVAAPLTGAGGVFFVAGGLTAAILSRPATAAPALLAGVVVGAVACVVGGIRGVRAARGLN